MSENEQVAVELTDAVRDQREHFTCHVALKHDHPGQESWPVCEWDGCPVRGDMDHVESCFLIPSDGSESCA